MDDLIRRSDVIDAILGEPPETKYPVYYAEKVKRIPSAKPELLYCDGCKWEETSPYVGDCVHCARAYKDYYEKDTR